MRCASPVARSRQPPLRCWAKRAATAIGSLVTATADPDTNTIEVSATNIDPDVATARVTAFVAAFLEVVNGDVIAQQQENLAQYQLQLDDAKSRLEAFDAANPGARSRPDRSRTRCSLSSGAICSKRWPPPSSNSVSSV